MPFEENVDLFFELPEFGSPALLQGKRIIGLLEIAPVLCQDVQTQKTTFTCASEAIETVALEKPLTLRIGNQAYAILEQQADGTGLTRLLLERLCN